MIRSQAKVTDLLHTRLIKDGHFTNRSHVRMNARIFGYIPGHYLCGSQLEFSVHGVIAVVQSVLPDMLERGSATISVTTGGSSVFPNAVLGNIALAAASLRNWALSLNAAASDKSVHVELIAINATIGNRPGAEMRQSHPCSGRHTLTTR